MARTKHYTYWDAGADGLGVAVVHEDDEPGRQPQFVVNRPPKGAKVVPVERAVEIVKAGFERRKEQHDAREAYRVSRQQDAIAEREAHIAEVEATGISRAAAEAMFPPITPYTPSAFTLPGGWQKHLAEAYGFNDTQIAQIGASVED